MHPGGAEGKTKLIRQISAVAAKICVSGNLATYIQNVEYKWQQVRISGIKSVAT
jgi:hypothetical protein